MPWDLTQVLHSLKVSWWFSCLHYTRDLMGKTLKRVLQWFQFLLRLQMFYSRVFGLPCKPFWFQPQHRGSPRVSPSLPVYLSNRIGSLELGTKLRAPFSLSLHSPPCIYLNTQIWSVMQGLSLVILCFQRIETKRQWSFIGIVFNLVSPYVGRGGRDVS